MKGGVAAMLVAASRAKALNLCGDVIVACVSDEEYASIGSFELVKTFKADAAIVTEPTELELVTAHKGFVWLQIDVHGKAAHGSRPLEGIDAIAKMGKVLVALERMDLGLRANPTHAMLESGSVHASMISGGLELSSYPALCTLEVERRTIPGETLEVVEAQFRTMLEEIKTSDSSFEYSLKMGLERVPHEVGQSELIVQTLLKNATEILEQKSEPKPSGRIARHSRALGFQVFCLVLLAQGHTVPTNGWIYIRLSNSRKYFFQPSRSSANESPYQTRAYRSCYECN
jgi:acetylornithine deacetylase